MIQAGRKFHIRIVSKENQNQILLLLAFGQQMLAAKSTSYTCSTVCIRDLDKLNLVCGFDFWLELIFCYYPKKYCSFQQWSKKHPNIINSLLLAWLSLNPWYTTEMITWEFIKRKIMLELQFIIWDINSMNN